MGAPNPDGARGGPPDPDGPCFLDGDVPRNLRSVFATFYENSLFFSRVPALLDAPLVFYFNHGT